MGAFVFDKCCFCIELKTGCFIIGYLSLIGYSIMAVAGLLLLIGGAVITQNPSILDDKEDSFSSSGFPKHNDEVQAVGILVILFSALFVLFIVVMLTFVIVLLVGLHKNKPGHLKAYLVFSCIFIVVSILGVIGSAVSSGDAKSITQNIFNILWSIYTTLVIRSQYFVMRSPERGPAIYSAA